MSDGTARGLQTGGALLRGLSGFQAGKINARMARREADGALREGVAGADQVRADARRTAGEAVAAMSAAGGGLGEGSALDVLRDIQLQSGLDELRLKRDAGNRAGALRFQGRLARRQGALDLVASAVDAASSFAGKPG